MGKGRRVTAVLLFLLATLVVLLAPHALRAQETGAVVRLSFVQGTVSIAQGDKTQFPQAQANMPLFAGYSISTGEDGQAEVEFLDGSVARLTPQSRLDLIQLPRSGTEGEPTELALGSGLGYFELNTQYGQRYRVRFADDTVNPEQNSIFRISLDQAPELAVFAGTVHAKAGNGFDQSIEQGSMVTFAADEDSQVQLSPQLRQESWDQWNQDRDDQIARQAAQQTSAREESGAPDQPGWDDLDAYGNWYPVEGYGDVWAPNEEPAGWDPYGSGYWANYPGLGFTWISGYPWGWLPYQCGAWNYWSDFGWGWIPGECGLGWQNTIVIRNAPYGYRPPPRPIPAGNVGTRLFAIHRAPVRGPGGVPVAQPGNGAGNHHTPPVRVGTPTPGPRPVAGGPVVIGGRAVSPLPVLGAGRGTPVAVHRGNEDRNPDGTGLFNTTGVSRYAGGGIAAPQEGAIAPAPARPIYQHPIGQQPVYQRPLGNPQPMERPGIGVPNRGGTLPPRVYQPTPRAYEPPSSPRTTAPPPRVMAPAPPRVTAPPPMSAPRPAPSAPAPVHAPAPSAPAPVGHH